MRTMERMGVEETGATAPAASCMQYCCCGGSDSSRKKHEDEEVRVADMDGLSEDEDGNEGF
jgi:hypothetical protein